MKKPFFYIERRPGKTDICLPEGFDMYNLIDISKVGDTWATFLNIETDEEISCEKYYKELQKYNMTEQD